MKYIQNISPFVAHHFIDEEIPLPSELGDKVDMNAESLGTFQKYLNRLHDSWVMSVAYSPNGFAIRLNDFVTHVFADALIQYKGLTIDEELLEFPVELQFDNATVSYNLVNHLGQVRQTDPFSFHHYIDEDLITADSNSAEIAFVVWVKGVARQRGHYGLLLIKASKVHVQESQDQVWQSVFGDDFSKYYDRFKKEVSGGRYLADQSLCLTFLSEIDHSSP